MGNTTRKSIKNYTTAVPVTRTVSEIMEILAQHGAVEIRSKWRNQRITSLSFCWNGLIFELPGRVEKVHLVLQADRVKGEVSLAQSTLEHAECVAWRNLKDWVDAQFALIDTQTAQVHELFLSYMQVPGRDTTVFAEMEARGMKMLAGSWEV